MVWLLKKGKTGSIIFIIVLHIAKTCVQSGLDGPVSFLFLYVCVWDRFVLNFWVIWPAWVLCNKYKVYPGTGKGCPFLFVPLFLLLKIMRSAQVCLIQCNKKQKNVTRVYMSDQKLCVNSSASVFSFSDHRQFR